MGRLEDLLPGKFVEKKVMARRVAVYNDNGNIIGMESDCKHMGASLAGGKVEKGVVTCPWHGWHYELRTGKCLNVDGADLKKFKVEIVDGEIFLLL